MRQILTSRPVKVIAILLAGYVGLVALFETLLAVVQPEDSHTLVIATTREDGSTHERVLSTLETDGRIYVAVNHWPRAWYRQALENPQVQVTIDGERGDYRAVPVTGAEEERLREEHPTGLFFQFLTGFPPRYFLRFDPLD